MVQVTTAVGWNHERLEIPSTIDERIAVIIRQCFEGEPENRPNFETIILSLRAIRSSMLQNEAQKGAIVGEHQEAQKAAMYTPFRKARPQDMDSESFSRHITSGDPNVMYEQTQQKAREDAWKDLEKRRHCRKDRAQETGTESMTRRRTSEENERMFEQTQQKAQEEAWKEMEKGRLSRAQSLESRKTL